MLLFFHFLTPLFALPSLHLCTTTILFIVKSMSDFDSDFPLFSVEVDKAKVNWKEVVLDELFVDGKQDLGYLPESNLGCHAKAELHLLRLLCGALELRNGKNESTYVPILAHLMFCHRADHVNFPVRKKGLSDLTNEAKAYLQGKEVRDLIDVPEESFIRFLIAVEIARYHFSQVEGWFQKYQPYIAMPRKVKVFLEQYKTQNGVFATTRKLKGFRQADICIYLSMQASVRKERDDLAKLLNHLKDMYSPSEITTMQTTGYPTIGWSVFPFKFLYDSKILLIVKKEKVAKESGFTIPAESTAISAYSESEV